MAEPVVGAARHRIRWGWWLVGLVVVVIAAVLIGYQVVQPFSDWANEVLGLLHIGE